MQLWFDFNILRRVCIFCPFDTALAMLLTSKTARNAMQTAVTDRCGGHAPIHMLKLAMMSSPVRIVPSTWPHRITLLAHRHGQTEVFTQLVSPPPPMYYCRTSSVTSCTYRGNLEQVVMIGSTLLYIDPTTDTCMYHTMNVKQNSGEPPSMVSPNIVQLARAEECANVRGRAARWRLRPMRSLVLEPCQKGLLPAGQ